MITVSKRCKETGRKKKMKNVIKECVLYLFEMDKFVLNVMDNGGWLMYVFLIANLRKVTQMK